MERMEIRGSQESLAGVQGPYTDFPAYKVTLSFQDQREKMDPWSPGPSGGGLIYA